MEGLLHALAMGWGGIIAIGIVLVLLIIVFIVVLRKAIRSGRE